MGLSSTLQVGPAQSLTLKSETGLHKGQDIVLQVGGRLQQRP